MRFKLFLAAFIVAASSLADGIGPMPERFRANAEAAIARADGIKPQDYPDADFVVLDTASFIRYEPDGRSTSWDEEWVLILTEKGRRDFATVELTQNLRYGDAEIQEVDIARGGKVEPVDFKKTLKWATDNDSMSVNIYDPQHQTLSCGVPGIKVGDIRHLVFARRMLKPRVKDTWGDMQVLEYTAPLMAAHIAIDAPDALPPVHVVLRHPLGDTVKRLPDEKIEEGRTILSWEAKDIAQAFEEPNMPPFYTQVQYLMFSTIPDWPTMSRWYWNLCLPHLEKVTDEMREKTLELVKDADGDMAKIRALYRFVAQEIRYMGVIAEDGAPGYEPHDVSLTFDNRYGVCRDKAALLAAMLAIAGVEAYPVLIHAGAKLDAEVPVPMFNHAITAAVVDGEYVLMDPTDESSRDLLPAYLSDRSFLVARPDGDTLRTSPVKASCENAFTADTRGTLSRDGSIDFESVMHFGGINDNTYRQGLLRMTEEDRTRLFSRILCFFSGGAELTGCSIEPADLHDTERPLEITLKGHLPDMVLKGETRDALTVPFMSSRIGAINWALSDATNLEKRRFPLHIDNTCESRETVTLDISGALGEPLTLPADETIGEGSGYTFSRTTKVEGGILTATRSLSLSAVEFTPAEYDELKESKKQVETALRANPTFVSRGEGNADTRLVAGETDTFVHSPKSWVSTNHIVRAIRTYRGKKNFSEIDFTLNTAVGDIRMLSAKVTSPDGRESVLTEKEVNVMDAAWVGAAPRYPASKLVVVSLPGVEIGSTIEYTTLTTVTNAPAAFLAEYTFDGNDPIDFRRVDVEVDASAVQLKAAGKAASGLSADGGYHYEVRSPKEIAKEPSQPPAILWRDIAIVSAADWKAFARDFCRFYIAKRSEACSETRKWARAEVAGLKDDAAKIETLRRAVVRKIRLAGPSLYEVPFERAFFTPDRTLADGYASSADRMNLLAAALEAVGFDVEVKLCSCDGKGWRSVTEMWQDVPRPTYFDSIVLKVSKRTCIWPFGSKRTWYLGGENEYNPLFASAHLGDMCFDPKTCTFETIGEEFQQCERDFIIDSVDSTTCMYIRENGMVDVDSESRLFGSGVGAFRKLYEEMLPEDRSRHYLSLLGELSDNASATRELETDTKGYPALRRFSAVVPGMAVVADDSISIEIPDFTEDLVQVGGPVRKTPIAVRGADVELDTYRIVFPEGYDTLEHIPEGWELSRWGDFRVETQMRMDGRLEVKVSRRRIRRDFAAMFPADMYEYFKAQNRRATGRAGRTVVVRRSKGL